MKRVGFLRVFFCRDRERTALETGLLSNDMQTSVGTDHAVLYQKNQATI